MPRRPWDQERDKPLATCLGCIACATFAVGFWLGVLAVGWWIWGAL